MVGDPVPLLLLVLLPVASATSLSLRSEVEVEEGVTLREYRASSRSTDVWVLVVDLCADGVYLTATRAGSSTQSTGSWAEDWDLSAATNGDFYKTDPLRVYGDAVGDGARWPLEQTGLDPDYAGEWYWEHAGWIGFGHDGLEFSHTGWVKEHAAELGIAAGWANDDLTPDPPPGIVGLVSGFPELVTEGVVTTCADDEASDCFPDRSDMRDRHPRTAMGFTEDRGTLFLVVADGRTSEDAGLYGSELADILGQLGAWQAFNLDGGGSSQLWTAADGYVNDVDGNNNGGGTRSVANHWGIYAGGRSWLADRPGHCAAAPSCGPVPPEGRVIDDDDPCFRTFGRRQYWRDEDAGYGGHLYWTNAFDSESPDNWAWWRIEPEIAGDYLLEVWVGSAWSVFDAVEYEVVTATGSTSLRVDPTGAEGWLALGTFPFEAGGGQWLAVYDDQASDPGSDQHIAADALRVTRVGGDDTGDTGDSGGDTAPDSGGGDSGQPNDSGAPDGGDTSSPTFPGEPRQPTPTECGCGTTGAPSLVGLGAACLLAGWRRRRGGPGRPRAGVRVQ